MVKLLITALIGCISLGAAFQKQEDNTSGCQPVRRFEKGCGYDCLSEIAIDIGGLCTKKYDEVLAIKLCSNEPLVLSLYTSAANPFSVVSSLIDSYGYSPERIIFLRSEECISSTPGIAATEFWVIPKGKAMPGSVESIKYSQMKADSLTGLWPSAGEYEKAQRELPGRLNKSPESVAIVIGRYIKKPDPVMQRELRKITDMFEKMRVPSNRYYVRLIPWTGEYSESPAEAEPQYPSIAIVEMKKNKS